MLQQDGEREEWWCVNILTPPGADGQEVKFAFEEAEYDGTHKVFNLALENVCAGLAWNDPKYWEEANPLAGSLSGLPPRRPTVAEMDRFALEEQDERLFRLCDLDGNGNVSLEEFEIVYNKFSNRQLQPAGRLEKLWRDYDVDHDNSLSRAEFGAFMAEFQDTILFQECDVNNDKVLNREEAKKAILQSGFDINPGYLDGVWGVYDADGSDELDEDEFLQLMRIVRQRSTTNRSRAKYEQNTASATSGRPTAGGHGHDAPRRLHIWSTAARGTKSLPGGQFTMTRLARCTFMLRSRVATLRW